MLPFIAACMSIDTGREIHLHMEYGYVQPADFMWWKVGVAPIEDARQEPGLIGYLHDAKGQPIRSVHPQVAVDQWLTRCLVTELRRISVQPNPASLSDSGLIVTGRIIDFQVGTSIDQPTVYQARIRLRLLMMRGGEVVHRFEYSEKGTASFETTEVARPFEDLVSALARKIMRAAAKDVQEFVSRN
jgi:hypothetical protein